MLAAFVWAVAATLALGTIGGLWLSAQFLGRIDSMRRTAHRLMDGDWSRRIPLSRTDDDLTALARTFNRLFDRIEKLLRANKQVSADIAHDLRKPLAGVLRRLEAARDNLSSGVGRDAIGDAIGDIEGVLGTFNALLRIGQIEAGARRAAFRPLDLAEVAREVAEAFAPAAEDEGKTLVTRLDVLLPLAGDKELLVQMIANLIDNALGHTPAGSGSRSEASGPRRGSRYRSPTTVLGSRLMTWRRSFSVFIELARPSALSEPASVSRSSPRLPTCMASTAGPPTMALGSASRLRRRSKRREADQHALKRRDAMTAVESWAMTALAYSTDRTISIASTLPGRSGTATVTVR